MCVCVVFVHTYWCVCCSCYCAGLHADTCVNVLLDAAFRRVEIDQLKKKHTVAQLIDLIRVCPVLSIQPIAVLPVCMYSCATYAHMHVAGLVNCV